VEQDEKQLQIGEKEDKITCTPFSNWLWFERFDCIFGEIAKINGVHEGVD
jgi:hypothetical protein